jgi:hypothetical protein
LPRWKISKHRVQHITYEREIKAATQEEAMRIFEAGTAWPSSYDDRYGKVVQQNVAVVEQLPPSQYHLEECCWHDLPIQPTPVEELSQEFVDALLTED